MVMKSVTVEGTEDVMVPRMKAVIEDCMIFGTKRVVVPETEGVGPI